MKNPLILMLLLLLSVSANAQTTKKPLKKAKKPHQIVFQLSNADPEVHKGLMKQFGHILEAAPDTKIEVVCHGPGLDMLVKDKTTVNDKIGEFKSRGVKFFACENTMKQKNIDKAAIIPEADYVTAGIIYIVERQEQGWSYIKSGF